jgi:hypothetical protein
MTWLDRNAHIVALGVAAWGVGFWVGVGVMLILVGDPAHW